VYRGGRRYRLGRAHHRGGAPGCFAAAVRSPQSCRQGYKVICRNRCRGL
jgi:hypothetical protein